MASSPLSLPPWAKRREDPDPPDGWQEIPLVAASDIRFSNVDKKSYVSEKPVRLCNYTDVYSKEYVRGDEDFMHATASGGEVARFAIQSGDVIITKDSETPDDIGIPAVVLDAPDDLLCGYHLALIRPRSNQVDPVFLAKQVAHHRISRYYARLANGLTRYGLANTVVENTPVWLPEPPEQQRVAGILRKIDETIAKTEAVIAKLKAIKQGLLHDLLTRGLDDNGELRDPEKHPEQFNDSLLGFIPAKWSAVSIGDICILGRGRVISQKELQEHPGIYSVYSSQSEREGIFGYIDTYDFEGEYVTWTTDGANAGTVFYRSGRFNCTNVCGTLKAKASVNMRFLAAALSRRAKLYVSYIGNPKLMNNVMGKILVALPDDCLEQDVIAELLSESDARIGCEESYLSKLRGIKKGLMQDLLTGRVRVNAGAWAKEK